MHHRIGEPGRITLHDLTASLQMGWQFFRLIPLPSVIYASLATLIGLLLLIAIGRLGVSPMSIPLIGGFMLVAPVMLSGFFQMFLIAKQGRKPNLSTPFAAFFHSPLSIWMIAIFCAFVFLIWITDAAVLYSFTIGGFELPYQPPWLLRFEQEILAFWFWSALMGSVLALIIFCVSAFSVPLIFEGRGTLVQTVHASVRAVLHNLIPCLAWAVLLALSMLFSILLLPCLLLILPVMAYASFDLYRKIFPCDD